MSISKLAKSTNPFEQICRKTIQSINNPVALAIWVYLQSKPAGWTVRREEVKDHFGIGEERYSKAMHYLRDVGLVENVVERNLAGRITGKTIHVHHSLPMFRETRSTASHNYGEPEDIENTDLLENTDTLEKKRVVRFAPPALDEVKKYFSDNMLDGDALDFHDYYESNGWLVGRKTMKDWKAAARRWSRKQKNYAAKRPERPVNGVPKTHDEWNAWTRKNGLGDGPTRLSKDQFVAWAQQKHKEKTNVRE